MIYDQSVLGMDYLEGSRQTLPPIDFKLKDASGNVIDFEGIPYISVLSVLRLMMNETHVLEFCFVILEHYRILNAEYNH